MQVIALSAADSLQPLVDLASHPGPGLASGRGHLAPSLSPQDVDAALDLHPWASIRPELALVFGPALTLAGFPPWSGAKMELQHLGPLASVTRRSLDSALQRYCRTDQRFGR